MDIRYAAGPEPIALTITAADLQVLPAGVKSCTVTRPIPAGARFAGLELGEGTPIAFASPSGAPWTATATLSAAGVATAAVGPTLDPLPVGPASLSCGVGHLVGGQTLSLTVATGGATAATLTTSAISDWTALNGLTLLGLTSDAAATSHDVTFEAVTNQGDALAQIGIAIGVDGGVLIATDAGGGLIALSSVTTGAGSSVTITGGTALALLGLTAGTVPGADPPDVNTATTGRITATLLITPN